MRRIKEVLDELLKEIDQLCSQYHIKYFISPELLLISRMKKEIPDNPHMVKVLMQPDDFLRFYSLKGKMNKNRTIDLCFYDEDCPEPVILYSDSDTISFQLKDYLYRESFGLHVQILPMIPLIEKKTHTMRILFGLQNFLRYDNRFMQDTDRIASFFARKIRFITGRKRYRRFQEAVFLKRAALWKAACADCKEFVLWVENEKKTVKRSLLMKRKRVPVSQHLLYAPESGKAYVSLCSRKTKRNINNNTADSSVYKVTSTIADYRTFLQDTRSVKTAAVLLEKKFVVTQKEVFLRKNIKQAWNFLKLYEAAFRIRDELLDKKRIIKELYLQNDYMELGIVFHELEQIQRVLCEIPLAFHVDEELDAVFLAFLKYTGKEELIRQLKNCEGSNVNVLKIDQDMEEIVGSIR